MELVGMDTCLAGLAHVIEEVESHKKTAVKLAGQAYANDVKVLAPYKTGTYRRSIHVQEPEMDINGNYTVLVGTDLPYAKRLEFGYWGLIDSLGRLYHQYPRPHFRPPYDTERDRYLAIMRDEVTITSDYLGEKLEEWETNSGIAGSLGILDTSTMMSTKTSILGNVRPDLVSGSSASFGYESTDWGF